MTEADDIDAAYQERLKQPLTDDVWIKFLLSVSVDREDWSGRGSDGNWEGHSEITGADLRCPVCEGFIEVPSNPSANVEWHRRGHEKDCTVLARLEVYFEKQARSRSELVCLTVTCSDGTTRSDRFAGGEKTLSIYIGNAHATGFAVKRERDEEPFIYGRLEAQSGTSGTCDVGPWSCDHVYPDRFVVSFENAPIGEKNT